MDNYASILHEMIKRLARLNYAIIGDRTGAAFNIDDETLTIPFFGKQYSVSKTECRPVLGSPDEMKDLILIIDYLLSFGGLDVGEEWIDFRDLPGSMPYDGAFRANVESLLEAHASEIIERKNELINTLSGHEIDRFSQYDFSVAFRVFPRLECLVLLSKGDDEIGAGAKVLFTSNAHHFMTTESLAAIAESLVRRLIR